MRGAACGAAIETNSMTKERLKKNEYRCAVCGGVFTKGWSEEEAVAEMQRDFPDYDLEQCDVVCDGCYREILEDAHGG
jgi:hypothetical protein